MIIKGNHEIVRRLTFQGMKISVETDKGQYRHWRDEASGESGKTLFHVPYGYFEGTKSRNQAGDNMALDAFVGSDEDAKNVYVVHQMKKPDFKQFDELKCMVGFESEKHARATYLMHYNDERFLGSLETFSVDDFKKKYIGDVEKALMDMPPGHVPGMVVPKGGSSCASCKFVSADHKHCSNSYWVKWHKGNPELPAPADQYCCDMYEPLHPIEQPTNKALYNGPVGQPGQQPNPNAAMPMGMAPQMPIMPGMMPLGPPPIDVETLDGVQALLGRVGSMKDTELLQVAGDIWGDGYQYMNATPEHVRCEVAGFLLDQRELLGIAQQMLPPYGAPSNDPMLSSSSPTSSGGTMGAGAGSNGASSSGAAFAPPPSTGSLPQGPSKNTAMDQSGRIG